MVTTISRSLQEGQDIFGVDFDYEEFEKYGDGEDYEDEDEEDLDEYIEDDEEEGSYIYTYWLVPKNNPDNNSSMTWAELSCSTLK